MAAPVQKLTLSPSTADVDVVAGGTVQQRITLVNQGSQPVTLSLKVSPYSVSGDQYTPDLQPISAQDDPSRWVTIGAEVSSELRAGAMVEVMYSVSIPSAAKPGGYYAAITADAVPRIAAGGVTIHHQLVHIIYITVPGDVTRSGDYTARSSPWFSFGGQIDMESTLRNDGGVHYLADISMEVHDIFGRSVDSQALQRYVLPRTERRIDLTWRADTVFGVYRVNREARFYGATRTLPDMWILIIHPLLLGGALFGIAISLWWRLRRRSQAAHAKMRSS
ncbi:MAG: hypothetical protein WAT17_04370 [Candidatus Saccharimonadales bacterium]